MRFHSLDICFIIIILTDLADEHCEIHDVNSLTSKPCLHLLSYCVHLDRIANEGEDNKRNNPGENTKSVSLSSVGQTNIFIYRVSTHCTCSEVFVPSPFLSLSPRGAITSGHVQPNGPMETDHTVYGKNVRTLCVPSLCGGGNARV